MRATVVGRPSTGAAAGGYYHLVFQRAHALVPLMWQNQRVLFQLLFEASAATLLEVAAAPSTSGRDRLPQCSSYVGQTLQPHPHVHCVVPGGGLSPDHRRWIRSPNHFFLPVNVLSKSSRFAGKSHSWPDTAARRFAGTSSTSSEPAGVAREKLLRIPAYAVPRRLGGLREEAFRRTGTRTAHLARYTHRVAISNHRLRGDRYARLVPLEGLRPP